MSLHDDAIKMLGELQRTASQQFLPDPKLAEIFEHDLESARSYVKDGLNIMFSVHGRDRETGKFEVQPILFADWPPPGSDGKRKAMLALGMKYHADFPHLMPMAVTQMSEGWAAERPQEDLEGPAPRNDPNRIEVMIVNTISMDQRQSSVMEKIKRDGGGHFTGLEPWIDHRYDPNEPTKDPTKETNYLVVDFFMGYFAALGGPEL